MRFLIAVLLLGGVAQAQQPINPYQAQQPLNPYAGYPPAGRQLLNPYPTTQVQILDPYAQPQGYQLSSPYVAPQAPVYYAPPCQPVCCNPCQALPPPTTGYTMPVYAYQAPTIIRPVKKWDGVRRWSLGVHGAVLGYNQLAGTDRVVLGGAGIQLRIRSKGRFGFEASQSFLGGTFLDGALTRNSFPFSASLMLFIFKNQTQRVFNIYGLAGIGFVPSTVKVKFRDDDFRSQSFTEFEAHLGVGLELRFKWFVIDADVRGFGFVRDSSQRPATYYSGATGEAVPSSSLGLQGRVLLGFAF